MIFPTWFYEIQAIQEQLDFERDLIRGGQEEIGRGVGGGHGESC